MKKILSVIVLITFLLIPRNVYAEEFSYSEELDYYIGIEKGGLIEYKKVSKIIRTSDKSLGYQLNLFDEFTTNNFVETSYDKVDKIKLIAYFGYGFSTHSNMKWYVATQFLIYREYGLDVFFTDKNGNKINILEKEIEEIKRYVYNYSSNNYPYFSNTKIEMKKNEVVEIVDDANILNMYSVNNNDGVSIRCINNKLTINGINRSSNINFMLKYNTEYIGKFKYYVAGNKEIIIPGDIEKRYFNLKLIELLPKIKVKVLDYDTNTFTEELKNMRIGITSDIEYTPTFMNLDDNGEYLFTNLKPNSYMLIDENNISGYEENAIIVIDLDDNDKEVIIYKKKIREENITRGMDEVVVKREISDEKINEEKVEEIEEMPSINTTDTLPMIIGINKENDYLPHTDLNTLDEVDLESKEEKVENKKIVEDEVIEEKIADSSEDILLLDDIPNTYINEKKINYYILLGIGLILFGMVKYYDKKNSINN